MVAPGNSPDPATHTLPAADFAGSDRKCFLSSGGGDLLEVSRAAVLPAVLPNRTAQDDTNGLRGAAASARSSLGQAGERWLHRLVGREETGDLAAGQLRSELCARLTEEFAVNHGDRRKDRLH